MSKIKHLASTLVLIVMGFMFATCSDSDSDIEDSGLVNMLKANMWEYKDVGDYKEHEYGGYYGTTTERLYFTDNNIGYCLLIEKDHDSYFGDSKETTFYKFTYSVSGNTVRWNGYDYKYVGGYLVWDDLIYEPTKMTQSQRDYLNRKIQELNEEEENEEISSSIYDYVDVTGKYNEEDYTIKFTINTELGKEFPGKSFKYGIEYGYGNYNNTAYCEMSGLNSETFRMSVIFDATCNLYMQSYNALKEKMERGEQLSESEIDLLEASVNGIEKNVNKFKARVFVEFDGERYYLYDGFYVTIDLDEYWVNNGGGNNGNNNPNTGGGNNGNNEPSQGGNNGPSSGYINGHEWVDLGLSVKWATCNVGASKPEGYGYYYAWGETTTKSDYSSETYKWCKGTDETMTKYCTDSYWGTVDNRTTLTSSDDVATVKWGSKWRMPTKEEMKELVNDCTWKWTTQNGVEGMKVTGPNGNSIFLPAAGFRNWALFERGSVGQYWSATLYEYSSDHACDLYFGSGRSGCSSHGRVFGFTVRPVTE